MLPDEGVDQDPHLRGSGRRARPYAARDPHLRGVGEQAGSDFLRASAGASRRVRRVRTWMAGEQAGTRMKLQMKLQESILKDTQCVLRAYVTMYITKERDRSTAQVRTLVSTLLVHCIY